ncbi:haloacid dehalogenase-like hydrolase family protein [Mollisia scopiformis]|uniref:Haloacid dehalogenase-like hydrolase family protein n=1 Tax=Mollisia scopiformis TaxID=149040 RepID=A0A194XJP1_MOLSC|nr:haloacid dehalogenase-like hydrolase family protein [Mollisia scopiformis]KUJ20324.1 haloacid dehalogenase-like hydrolase family protein [Mollisia scopiformis]
MGKVRNDDPSKLTDFQVLSFDVYSTLIDEPGGMFIGLQPLLSRFPSGNPYQNNRTYTLSHFQKYEKELQTSQPSLRYNELLPLAYKAFAASLNLPEPSQDEALSFGASIGSWPAFPDTVAALQSLKKRYKLVMLSNIDNDSIARTISGPLAGVDFDLVLTAQEIGSYKPDLRNFEYLVRRIKEELGIEKERILHTAQSLSCDQVPAKQMGMSSVWIDREGQDEKVRMLKEKGEVNFTWRFESMGEMAEAVEKET